MIKYASLLALIAGTVACAAPQSEKSINRSPSALALHVGESNWIVNPNLEKGTSDIFLVDSTGCRAWTIALNEKSWKPVQHDTYGYFRDISSGGVEVIENATVISFRPTTPGSRCENVPTQMFFTSVISESEVGEHQPYKNASSILGLQATSAEWEYPSDFAYLRNTRLSPLISMTSSKAVGIVVGKVTIETLAYHLNEVRNTGSSIVKPVPDSFKTMPVGFLYRAATQVNREHAYNWLTELERGPDLLQKMNSILTQYQYSTLRELK